MGRDFRVGTDLAGYRIEGLLGRGGMGVVYLAEDLRLGRRVALKVLSPDLAADEQFRDRFVRESKIAASLEHPSIVPVYEAADVGGQLYLAMRYIRGTDLKTLIREQGHLEPDRAMAILGQVASALDAAHGEGLVHRDIKPGNILVGESRSGEETAYLTDFGLTKQTASQSAITATGQFIGTMDYAAPEQFEGKPANPSADIYSLTGVLFECLTGEVPYPRDQDVALMFAHLRAPPPRVTDKRADLPKEVDDVVAAGMAKIPEERFGSAGDLIRTAGSVLLGEELSESQAGEWKRRRRRLRRRRNRVIVGVTAFLVALAVAVPAIVLGGDGGPPAAPPVKAALVRIDPKTNKVVGNSLELDRGAAWVAAGEGAVWIANTRTDQVLRVDPETGELLRSIPLGSDPRAITVGGGTGAAWVITTNKLWKIDSLTGTPGTIGLDSVTRAVATGEGTVWVALGTLEQGKVQRIDPARVILTSDVIEESACCVAIGEGAVWLVAVELGSGQVELVRIDLETKKVVTRIPLAHRSPVGLTVAQGRVWVAFDQGTIALIDTGRNEVAEAVSTGPGAVAIVSGEGGIWVLHRQGGVTRVDPISGDVVGTITVTAARPIGIAAGEGSVWVVAAGPAD